MLLWDESQWLKVLAFAQCSINRIVRNLLFLVFFIVATLTSVPRQLQSNFTLTSDTFVHDR